MRRDGSTTTSGGMWFNNKPTMPSFPRFPVQEPPWKKRAQRPSDCLGRVGIRLYDDDGEAVKCSVSNVLFVWVSTAVVPLSSVFVVVVVCRAMGSRTNNNQVAESIHGGRGLVGGNGRSPGGVVATSLIIISFQRPVRAAKQIKCERLVPSPLSLGGFRLPSPLLQ